MKTIQEIADEIGVNKEAIRKRISREPLCSYMRTHTRTKGNTKYIDEAGEILIKYAFDKIAPMDKIEDKKENVHSEIITILYEQLKAKDKQLNARDKQIAELIASIKPKPQKKAYQRKKLAPPKPARAPIVRLLRVGK